MKKFSVSRIKSGLKRQNKGKCVAGHGVNGNTNADRETEYDEK